MSARPSLRWLALIGISLVAAFAASGVLYVRSRAADFRRHAGALESFSDVRQADELLSEQVLAARFGLLNQYDPLNETERSLAGWASELRVRIEDVVGADARLIGEEDRLDAAIAERRQTVERFKAENSVLKNSVYYLPTAARDLIERLPEGQAREPISAIGGLTEAALVYSLVGDDSARDAYAKALARLEAASAGLPADVGPRVQLLFSHARVIRDRQAAVDGWVKRALDGSVGGRLSEVQRLYDERFDAAVATSNAYRRVLYAWSVLLAIAVGAASVQLGRLYAGLERRVAERTAELAKALDALWGEMRLARKIQEALVPAAPTLARCDVAVAMKPADDVGGDYYDVVVAGGREWILIGDVSGHGVPAGLVMMMCHTAVRAVLRGHPDVMPAELLAQVNTVLTENIRQLGEDKYMTITALRRDLDGTVYFAGAHQDLLVYRAKTDTVDVFETAGIWLGIKDGIADSLVARSLVLSDGDVLVAHTDGITEATQGETMFDTAGLRGVVARSRGKSAREILDDTFRALEGFVVADDATLLVIRQLGA